MIRAIVTDVDGVLTGSKEGFNSPKSHPEIISALKEVSKKGIPVVLCTAKIASAIEDIIEDADLRNPHISDAGTFIFDLLDKKIINEHLIDPLVVSQIIQACVANKIHCSAHTMRDVFIDKTHNREITQLRTIVLKRELTVVDLLEKHVNSHRIIKITLTVQNEKEQVLAKKLLEPFKEQIHLIWSHHPMSDPWKYGIISRAGISKASAAREVAKILHVPMEEVLGVGDGIADWVFMQECGYAGVVGRKDPELLELAATKGEGRYFLAPSVDENGFLQILKHFKLI